MWASGVKAVAGSAVGFESRVSVQRQGAQNLEGSTWTVIQWNTEIYDGLNEMDIESPWKFTAVATGYYHITASLNKLYLDAGEIVSMRLVKNESYDVYLAPIPAANEIVPGNDTPVQIAQTLYLEASDYITVEGWHNIAAASSVGQMPCFLTIDRIA